MSSAWAGSTETVGVSTKRLSSVSNSSRCELAKDIRLSRFNVVGIQNPPSNCRAKTWNSIIKQIGPISPIEPLTTGDQFLSCGITKLRQLVPRTFKRFGASCYSDVPCFLPETGPTVRTRDIQFFRRVCVRKRSFAPGILFLVLALAVPALIFAQQNRSARRATTPDRSTTGASTTSKTAVTGPMIKNDFAEALSVIQSNHIDGPKLDYKAIFKSSISGMLSVLDPHSTYFDPDEYASFRTRSEE